MKIAVFGLSKSGTSALYARIRSALPASAICLFEPRRMGYLARGRVKAALRGDLAPHILAKVLPFNRTDPVELRDFSTFDKQILIVRDARDRLISYLLYRAYNREFAEREHAVRALLEALRTKEAVPQSVSVLDLFRLYAEETGETFDPASFAADYGYWSGEIVLDFLAAQPGLKLFRYEDLVAGRVAELEDHLGLSLAAEGTVGPALQRVVRTRASGQWASWFTESDVCYFEPVMRAFQARFYPDADWKLSRSPTLPPEHGSLYVRRVADERRTLSGLPPLGVISPA